MAGRFGMSPIMGTGRKSPDLHGISRRGSPTIGTIELVTQTWQRRTEDRGRMTDVGLAFVKTTARRWRGTEGEEKV